METILSGLLTVAIGVVNFIFQFFSTIFDELFFNYLPDVSLILGYVNAFVQVITQHLDWLLDLTGLEYSFFNIAFGLYLLRFALIPVAYAFGVFVNIKNIFDSKGGL